ncbi:hypothetical protein [Halococcus salifodinae]|nr:hypothetical protein [Halococcus salifodinae]
MKEITEKTLHPLVFDVFITAIHDQLRQYGGTRLGVICVAALLR